MILFEKRAGELIGTMAPVQVNGNLTTSVKFYWGDEEDLQLFIKKTGNENYFPLIWLVTGRDEYPRSNRVRRKAEFVILTRETDRELLNTERIERSFNYVLNPITNSLVELLSKSTISNIVDNKYYTQKFTNYSSSERGKDKNLVNDIWDAIKLTCEVEFNDRTLNICKNAG